MKYEVTLKETKVYVLEIDTGEKDPTDTEADEDKAVDMAWDKLTETKTSRDEYFHDSEDDASAYELNDE